MKSALTFGVVLGCVLGFRASAQTPADLDIQVYAGLTITGAVGTVYSVESVTDLAQTSSPSAWRCAEYVQLPDSPYLWTDRSAPATNKRFYRAVVFVAPTNMVFIPPGTFRMGSPTNEIGRPPGEGPQTAVTISRGFLMGKYEVTQREFLAVMGGNPSYFNGDRTPEGGTNYGVDLSRPVETVSWNDATAYCASLTDQERSAGRIPTNCVYRLPSDAEWEYACRAWTSTRVNYGDDPGYTNLSKYAWYWAHSDERTHPVGQKLPNLWGLYDMYGNVEEWCRDWWWGNSGGIALDPQGPAAGTDRMIRGGDWSFWGGYPETIRSAERYFLNPETRDKYFGFRVVLAPTPT